MTPISDPLRCTPPLQYWLVYSCIAAHYNNEQWASKTRIYWCKGVLQQLNLKTFRDLQKVVILVFFKNRSTRTIRLYLSSPQKTVVLKFGTSPTQIGNLHTNFLRAMYVMVKLVASTTLQSNQQRYYMTFLTTFALCISTHSVLMNVSMGITIVIFMIAFSIYFSVGLKHKSDTIKSFPEIQLHVS